MPAKRRVRRKKRKDNRIVKLLLQGVGLGVVLVVAYWLARLAQGSETVRMTVASYGYVGVFVISFISGLNLVVPVPAVAFLPVFLESGLSFLTVVIIMSAGMTVADAVGYGFGSLGRKAYTSAWGNAKAIKRIERFRKHHRHGPLLALLVFSSLAPLPNEVMVIPMGILGYRLRNIMPVVFVGNIVFNTIYASGIVRLFNLV